RMARVRQECTGHDAVAARLVHQVFADPVVMLLHIEHFLSHRFSFQWRKTADQCPCRVSPRMCIDRRKQPLVPHLIPTSTFFSLNRPILSGSVGMHVALPLSISSITL